MHYISFSPLIFNSFFEILFLLAVCRNKFSNTFCSRFKPECQYIDRIQSVQMAIFCPATCGICNGMFLLAICSDFVINGYPT